MNNRILLIPTYRCLSSEARLRRAFWDNLKKNVRATTKTVILVFGTYSLSGTICGSRAHWQRLLLFGTMQCS